MRDKKTAARLTLCLISGALLTACAPPIRIAKPPADKMTCAPLPAAPKLTPLDWASVQSVDQAKALVFAREGETAEYIVALRAAWFSCASTVGWHRNYNAALPN
jgi:hypothetical protein